MAPELSIENELVKYDYSVDVFALGLVYLVVFHSDEYRDLLPRSGKTPVYFGNTYRRVAYIYLACLMILNLIEFIYFLSY